MEDPTLFIRKPVSHLEVSASSWFYMNHLRRPEDSVVHDHNFLEIAFILKGGARHFVVHQEERCSAGDVYIIPIGAWHGYCDSKNLEILNCLLSPSLLENELGWMRSDPIFRTLFGLEKPQGFTPVRKLHLSASLLQKTVPLLSDLETAVQKNRSRIELLGRILLVLDVIHTVAQKSVVEESVEAAHLSVQQAVKMLYDRISEEWTLEKLGAELRLNPSYLVRLFQSGIGISPMKFLARIRAERAATLLLSADKRIGDIGCAVGWSDPKRFATNFQKHFGLSASAYRQRRNPNTVSSHVRPTGSYRAPE